MTTRYPLTSLITNVVDNRGRSAPLSESGIALIATNCIKSDAIYPVFEKVRYVSEETYATWFRGHPRPGDIIIVNKGTPGLTALVPEPLDFAIAQDMVAIRADEEKIYPKYLFAYMRSREFAEQVLSLHVGTLIPHLKKSHFNLLTIPVPTKGVQRTIGDMFFSLSEKIELNRRMSGTLEQMARALFRSWFVDFDAVKVKARGGDPTAELGLAPEIAALFPDSFQDSPLGPIPTGWEAKPVGAHVAFNDHTLGSKDSLPALEYIEISGVSRGDVLETSWYDRAEAPSRARRRLRHGDTVVSTVRPEKGAYFLALEPHEALIASTGFAVLSPADVPWSLLHAAMTQPEVFEYMGRVADGGAYPAISPALIGDVPVTTPCNEAILEAFHGIAMGLYELSHKLRAESRVLAETRDYLLPRLLNGQVSAAAPTEDYVSA